MARESGLWNWLKKARVAMAEDLHMNRVENSTMSGMPDVEGYLRGDGQFWIELKSAARPARASTPVRFKVRGGQVEWLPRRWALGASAWLLLQVGEGASRSLYLVPGSHAGAVQGGLPEDRLRALDVLTENGVTRPKPETVVALAAHARWLKPAFAPDQPTNVLKT